MDVNLDPHCSACREGQTPFCPACERRAALHLDVQIASACAAMAEMSDERDRHAAWDGIKVLLQERGKDVT